MRVLITRPEREATTLATALARRGHIPVIAPLFEVRTHLPPADFAAALAACQAVLVTSANGVRALADASAQRGKPILAVGDTTAATAEGLGFTSVASASGDASALVGLVRERLQPEAGPLLHVSGVEVAGELVIDGFTIRRFALYEAHAASVLPDSARAALEARAIDAATFFSPRASVLFVELATQAGLADRCRSVTAVAISPRAAAPLKSLPFRTIVTAHRPTGQSVFDEIDRLADAVGQTLGGKTEGKIMSDTSPTPVPVVVARRGLGIVGAFVAGLIAAIVVLAGALFSLPYWPDEAHAMWRGPMPAPAAPTSDAAAEIATAKQELSARLDELDKRVRGLANTAAQTEKPAVPETDVAALRERIAALEAKPVVAPAPPPAPASSNDTAEKDIAALRIEIATLRSGLQTLDQSVSGQKEQASALANAIDKVQAASTHVGADEQKSMATARASAVIGIAARLSVAIDTDHPFASDAALLAPLAQDHNKIAEIATTLRPLAESGVASRAALSGDFASVARNAMADDLADDSFGQRVLGKLKALVSLRRVGADVPGDTVEAKLARAEAALKDGDLAKAVDLVKSLPPQSARAATDWLTRAEARLAAQQAVDQLAAEGVALLGAAR